MVHTATLGATARGDNASVSMRGIPSSNTLVLPANVADVGSMIALAMKMTGRSPESPKS